jgi:cyclophilin family peptidyl-prolyl cis-trans isomerase
MSASSQRKRSNPKPKQSTIKKNKSLLWVGIIIIVIIVIAGLWIIFGGNNTTNDNGTSPTDGTPIAVIDTSFGTIEIELYADLVPNTCDNFIRLVDDGFYDGLIFHRISDNFMIQGGLQFPDGTTKESPYGTIDLETHPDVRHIDGAISMARTNDPNSATSQFFICDGPQSFLDDQYAAFGRVVSGLVVVKNIAQADHDGSFEPNPGGGKPLEDIIINTITMKYV